MSIYISKVCWTFIIRSQGASTLFIVFAEAAELLEFIIFFTRIAQLNYKPWSSGLIDLNQIICRGFYDA